VAKKPPLPEVEIGVALITRGKTILAVFNPKWSAYSLPMTKRRRWNDAGMAKGDRSEDWRDTALRAAYECLGRPTRISGPLSGNAEPIEIAGFSQGDREGLWKHYRFHVYRVTLEKGEEAASGQQAIWLSVDQFLDPTFGPISPTARNVIREVQARAKLAGASFP